MEALLRGTSGMRRAYVEATFDSIMPSLSS
ncbi:Uncharacterised protein [Bordetella pertussis]|nr:Uncharacterised protein [Bordetella pertussis]